MLLRTNWVSMLRLLWEVKLNLQLRCWLWKTSHMKVFQVFKKFKLKKKNIKTLPGTSLVMREIIYDCTLALSKEETKRSQKYFLSRPRHVREWFWLQKSSKLLHPTIKVSVCITCWKRRKVEEKARKEKIKDALEITIMATELQCRLSTPTKPDFKWSNLLTWA